MARWSTAVALALVAVLTACGQRETAEPPATPGRPVAVEATAVQPTTVPSTFQAVGTVRARETALLASKITGYVRAIGAREGDRVQAGQLLITLDDRDAQAQVRRAGAAIREGEAALAEAAAARGQAEAALREAREGVQEADHALAAAEAARAEEMVQSLTARRRQVEARIAQAQAGISQAEARWSQVGARIKQAEADRDAGEILLGYTRITAPFAGLVTSKRVEVGDLATPGTPLFTVEGGGYRLEADVPESEVGWVKRDSRIRVVVDALGGQLAGRVAEIVPAADPRTRTLIVKIDHPSGTPVQSGLSGRAWFPTGARQALLIPAAALMERGQLRYVFVVEKGMARLRLVTTGQADGDRVEVLSGLQPGDRVVTRGMDRLADGDPVAAGS